ncbi:MAG: hypothetical protein ACUVYA_00125, partial [Planctomycetota bacterium]
MEEDAAEPVAQAIAPVDRPVPVLPVADDRAPEGGEVDADLVGAPGIEFDAEERGLLEPPLDPVAGRGG